MLVYCSIRWPTFAWTHTRLRLDSNTRSIQYAHMRSLSIGVLQGDYICITPCEFSPIGAPLCIIPNFIALGSMSCGMSILEMLMLHVFAVCNMSSTHTPMSHVIIFWHRPYFSWHPCRAIEFKKYPWGRWDVRVWNHHSLYNVMDHILNGFSHTSISLHYPGLLRKRILGGDHANE